MDLVDYVNPDGDIVKIWRGEYANIGADARIGEGAVIGGRVRIGEGAVIGERVVIGGRARIGEGAVIGADADIGEYADIGAGAVIGGRVDIGGRARIGRRANIGANARRHAMRSDGYVFTVGERNGERRVFAGCRDFNEQEAREHWNDAHPRGRETRAILDFLFMVL